MTKKLTLRRAGLAYTLSMANARVWMMVKSAIGHDLANALTLTSTRLTYSDTELADMFTAYCWICNQVDARRFETAAYAEQLKGFVRNCYDAYCQEWDERHGEAWTKVEAHAFANTSEEDMQALTERRNMSSMDLYNAERMKALTDKENGHEVNFARLS